MDQLIGQTKIYMPKSNTDVVQAFWIYAVCFLLVLIQNAKGNTQHSVIILPLA